MNTTKTIHIVSFDNPYPPVYGGVIDVFYKIKAFYEIGIKIILHCYVNEIPNQYSELESLVHKIYFYKREKSFFYLFSVFPFSVRSRNNHELLTNLSFDNNPIFFEGLQSTFVLNFAKFEKRKLFLRLHNLEDKYYGGLSTSETNFFKKLIFALESKKYTYYQKIIKCFDTVFTLSQFETQFVNNTYNNAMYIPVFHGNNKVNDISKFGKYAFYNGDLRVSDNLKAVFFFIDVFKEIPNYNLVVATSDLNILLKFKFPKNVILEKILNQEHLDELTKNAHINVMASFQKSGTKLKVVNALFKSRFCVINSNMIDDLELNSLCELAESKSEFIDVISKLKTIPYQNNEERKNILNKVLNDHKNALQMIEVIFR